MTRALALVEIPAAMRAESLAGGIAQGIEGQGERQSVAKDGLQIYVGAGQLIGLVSQLVARLDEELAKLEHDVERHRPRTASTVRSRGAPQTTRYQHTFDDALCTQLRFDGFVAETRKTDPCLRHRRRHNDVTAAAGVVEDVGDREN